MWAKIKSWLAGPAKAPVVLDPAWVEQVAHSLPCLDFVAEADRPRLYALTAAFLSHKQIAGGGDFKPDERIRLAVALQACLPILNLGLDWYREFVGVLIYPGSFVARRSRTDGMGVLHEYEDVLAGEAWQGGPVIVAWYEDPAEMLGLNPVIHEFAHKLDMLNGPPDGMPPLPAGLNRVTWHRVFQTAYDDFRRRVRVAEIHGQALEIDPYAAESPAEFFAVLSETFFETPLVLREEYPEVYEQLHHFYRQDPAAVEAAWEALLGESEHVRHS